MNTLYTDLQALLQDHCENVVCANAKLMEKDLRSLLERHKPRPTIPDDMPPESAYE